MPTLSPPELSDERLVAGARTGDAGALGELYRRHGRAMLALARRLLGSAEDAEDVLHDVFLGLPEALRRYDERGSLEPWLKRVTARVALNRARGRARTRETALDVTVTDVGRGADTLHDAMSLERAIDALPEAWRAVFVLKEIAGFTHAEVGRMLDITPGASEVRLHRAMRALRRSLVSPR